MPNPNPGPGNIRHPRYNKLKIAIFDAIAGRIEDLTNEEMPGVLKDVVEKMDSVS